MRFVWIILSAALIGSAVFLYFQNSDESSYQIEEITAEGGSGADIENVEELPACPTPTATNCRPVKDYERSKDSDCEGSGTVNLTVSPMDLDDIGLIIPMGAMVGNHVTPIDHMYLTPVVFHSSPDSYDVYANADGVIAGIGHEPHFSENTYEKYSLRIMHTCDFYSIYNLLTSLSPEITAVTGEIEPGSYSNEPIEVEAGQLLGKIGGQTLDLSVNYDKVILDGFVNPDSYAGESWKIHTVDPFDYFSEPIRSQLLAKNVRQAEPRGGKIDYDIDGRLVGSWFRDGIGYPENYVQDSWKNHASFVYDPIDPSLIIISLGDFDGESMQFSVEGNSPDPKDISVSTGLVEYVLVDFTYELDDGEMWDRMSYADEIRATGLDYVKGVALVQMIDDRKLKLEVFPGKTASQVSGFTSAARIYER